jgi:hypothetical protein
MEKFKVTPWLLAPYGPYGLYRASVPVQGCTFTFYLVTGTEIKVVAREASTIRGIEKAGSTYRKNGFVP